MKKIKFLGILLLIILLLSIIIIFIFNKIETNEEVTDIAEDRVLIECSYSNWAWEFQYYGTVVCESGNIYEFEFESDEDYISTDDLNEKSSNLLNNTTKLKKTISSSNMNLLQEYSKTVDENYETQNVAMDAGQSSIKLFDYEGDKIITLKAGGDTDIKNTSENVDEILNILNKYNISVNFLGKDF